MPSPLISVIVPIYNMESLLPRCLDSLAAQTLRDLEIICVDDGSTDGSGGIVRKYASGDSRFRLITQENSGRAEARNAGIRAAAAPYLGFADPDDYVEPDMYERLYRLAEESGADMVQCSYSPFLPAESGESRGMAEEKLLHIENTACDGVFTEKGEIFRLFLEDRITGVVWSKLFRRILPGCSAPLEVRLPSSFTSGEDTLYVSRAIARCRSVALTSEKLYHYGLGGPQSVSSRNRKAETRPASYYAVFEMLTREKLREGVLGSNRTAYMNYIVPLLFPDNEMPAGRLRHWAELWREADITSEHVCGMPREQRAYLEAALAGRWIYLRLLQCFWKFKTARRKMFRLRFSKNGIDTLQILGYTLDITPFPIQQTMPSPLISVIVPIYNMESLLPRCLDSLAAQTLRDLEIICVDDGSTDGSGGIVRKYASGDSRFRLITQENSGRAEARNAGIRAAAAPYLGFADPDDYVEPDMYERLYRLAEESGADMVQCSYSPFLPAESGESRGMAEEKLLHIENTACDGVFTEKGEIFRLFLEDRITGVVWSKLFRRILPGCSAPLEVRLPSSFTSGEDTLYVSRAIARCRSVALTSEKLYHYGLGGPQSVSSRNRKAETRPASYYAVFEMLTREKLREGVLGSNRTAYMNYIVPLLFPDNEMPAGRLRHWAELWREADITSEHVCGMPREQRAYLEAALAGRWIYLRLLQCFWKFKTARRKMFRLRFSKNGIDTLQILGYTLYSAKKFPRSSL